MCACVCVHVRACLCAHERARVCVCVCMCVCVCVRVLGDLRLVTFLHQTHYQNIHYIDEVGRNAIFFASSVDMIKYLHHFAVTPYLIANNKSTPISCLLDRVLHGISHDTMWVVHEDQKSKKIFGRTKRIFELSAKVFTDDGVSHCISLLFSYGTCNMTSKD